MKNIIFKLAFFSFFSLAEYVTLNLKHSQECCEFCVQEHALFAIILSVQMVKICLTASRNYEGPPWKGESSLEKRPLESRKR